MLQRITVPARRGYSWICSDCQKRSRPSAGRAQHSRVRNEVPPLRSIGQNLQSNRPIPYVDRLRILNTTIDTSQKRFYATYPKQSGSLDSTDDRNGRADNDSSSISSGSLEIAGDSSVSGSANGSIGSGNGDKQAVSGEGLEDFMDSDADISRSSRQYTRMVDESPWNTQSIPLLPNPGESDQSTPQHGYRWTPRKPMTRERLMKSLEKMNTQLAKGGYQLIEPQTPAVHNRVVTKSTVKEGKSLWKKFKEDYMVKYLDSDPVLLMGRGRGWRPTNRETKNEYKRYYKELKDETRKELALKLHYSVEKDLKEVYENILSILQRYTDPQVLEKYKATNADENTSNSIVQLDRIVSDWQQPLLAFEPQAYKSGLDGAEAHRQPTPPIYNQDILEEEVRSFKTENLKTIDFRNLSHVLGVTIPTLPANSFHLLNLINAIGNQKISKQNLRYVLPMGYNDGVEFLSQTIATLIIFHERSGALNTRIMNAAINHLMAKNQIKRGRKLMAYMEFLKISMDYETFTGAFRAASKAKDLVTFEFLLRRMLSKGILPGQREWIEFSLCAHSPGQQVEIYRTVSNLGMDPKKLDPVNLLQLALDMYKDNLRFGINQAQVPWESLSGFSITADTINKLINFLYEHRNFEAARDILHRSQTEHGMIPNYTTLKIVVKHNRRMWRVKQIVSYIRVFERRYKILAKGDVMEMLFRAAHRQQYYNVVRTVWAHACLTNQVTRGMINRMRHDVYETGRWAGKAGKLALGVVSEVTEQLVKTPVWAMRLVSKAKDPLAYLASDGTLYQKPETWNDLTDARGKMDQTLQFQKRAADIRKEIMRLDLLSHNEWKPRRTFSADLLEAFLRDVVLKRNIPEIRHWTPMTWVWNLFQVRRIHRSWSVENIINQDGKQRKREAKEKRKLKSLIMEDGRNSGVDDDDAEEEIRSRVIDFLDSGRLDSEQDPSDPDLEGLGMDTDDSDDVIYHIGKGWDHPPSKESNTQDDRDPELW